MGHDIHFLERLERVNPDHQALALRLYREPAETRRVLDVICTDLGLSDARDRIAIALEDGGQGPYIIVTRSGRFVTCLAKGMKIDGMHTIPRALIDANDEWRRFVSASADQLDHLVTLLRDVRGWLPPRAVLEEVSMLIGLLGAEIIELIVDAHRTIANTADVVRSAPRDKRRLLARGAELSSLITDWGHVRRALMHLCVSMTMGVRNGDPVLKHTMERRTIKVFAYWIASQRSPAALLRACWMLIQRQTVTADEALEEIGQAIYHEDGLLYLPALFGFMLFGEPYLSDVIIQQNLLVRDHLSERLDSGEFGTERDQALTMSTLRNWSGFVNRDAPLHERAVIFKNIMGTKIPRWAERFYDPARLKQDPEGAIQDLLALDSVVIRDMGEAAILWLYLPEIATRPAPMLYPVEPPPTPTPSELFTRDERYVQDFIQLGHAKRAVVSQKQGRNDPCACGSGKKYKKCCGVNQDD